jgi:hypothetical protein
MIVINIQYIQYTMKSSTPKTYTGQKKTTPPRGMVQWGLFKKHENMGISGKSVNEISLLEPEVV